MLLIFTCTYYAVKTRKLPHNYNETKYIGFAMYSSCVLCLSNIIIYFGTKSLRHEIKIRIYAIMLSITGFIIILFIFIPKIYRLLFKSEDGMSEEKKIDDGQTTFTSTPKLAVINMEDTESQYICYKCRSPRNEDATSRTKVTSNDTKTKQ